MSTFTRRPNRWRLYLLTTIALAAAIYFTPSHLRADDTAHAADVSDMQKEQIAALQQACDLAEKSYKSGALTVDRVEGLHQRLLEARLAAAASTEDQIAVLSDEQDQATQREMFAAKMNKAGLAPDVDVLSAKAERLRIGIMLKKLQNH